MILEAQSKSVGNDERVEGKGEAGSGRRMEGNQKMEEEFNQSLFALFSFLSPLNMHALFVFYYIPSKREHPF